MPVRRYLPFIFLGGILLTLVLFYVKMPISHPNVTGATLIYLNQEGEQVELKVAGLADKSGMSYIATSGEEFDLSGYRQFKVIYPSGEVKTYGNP